MVQNLAISIGSIVFVFVGFLTMNKGRKLRAKSGRIEEMATTAIRNVKPGPSEIKGSVRVADEAQPFPAPITGEEAIATQIEIQEWHSGGQGGGNWRTMHEEHRCEPLTVDDGTGEIRVELPDEGSLNLDQSEMEVESDDEPPDAIRRYVEEQTDMEIPERQSIGPLSVGEPRKYLDGVLKPHQEVYVLGQVRELDEGNEQPPYVIDQPTEDGDFILSNKSEANLIEEGKGGGLVFVAFGGLLTIVGLGSLIYPWLPM